MLVPRSTTSRYATLLPC
jgi:amidase